MLIVQPEVFDAFPGVVVGTLEVEELDNSTPVPALVAELRSAEQAAREALSGEVLVEHPRIAPWREAYRSFGAKPKKYPSSIEALSRRVLKGDELPSISPLVDIYNAVSLQCLLPVGAEDLDRMSGPMRLRFAGDAEPEALVLGRPQPEAPLPGELHYADDEGAICRRWNWREAARTAVSPSTTRAIVVVEALPPASLDDVATALELLAARVERYCGGQGRLKLHKADPG